MAGIVSGMLWFKRTFGAEAAAALEGTPFSLDLLTAIAVQETFEVWGGLFDRVPDAKVLELCVGDTIDAPRRHAFPKSKAQLVAHYPNGQALFDVARSALVVMGREVPIYGKISHDFPDKFCHAFGIFQYDLQYALNNPDFFLQHQWYSFTSCLRMVLVELDAALNQAYPGGVSRTLTDEESIYVAIAYNTGSVDFAKGYKQGHEDPNGKFYGEYIRDYLTLAHGARTPLSAAA